MATTNGRTRAVKSGATNGAVNGTVNGRAATRGRGRPATNAGLACIVPGCDRPAMSRGLCEGCYNKARELVKYGRTTWEKLVSMGLARASAGRRQSRLAEVFERMTARAGNCKSQK